MKRQIERVSPHQNGKVFGVLMALWSCLFVLPMSAIMMIVPAPAGQPKPPAFLFLVFPIFYLVFGYFFVAFGCWIYNQLFPHIGGFEFEEVSPETR